MPLQPNTDLELQKTTPTPMPQFADQEGPSTLDVLAAAERSSNLAGTLYDTITNAPPNPRVKPGFDPAVSIPKGYEAQADLFADVRSPEDLEARRQQIDRENQDKQTIARAGGWGFAATMAAGLTDPLTIASMAIPIGAPTRLAQAGKFALAAGTTTAAQELAMHQLQVTRTPAESALNVGASTVMGGVLGAAFRPHVSPKDFARMADTLHTELNDPHVPGETVLGPTDGRGRIVPETEIPPVPPHPESGHIAAPTEPPATLSVKPEPHEEPAAYTVGEEELTDEQLKQFEGLRSHVPPEQNVRRPGEGVSGESGNPADGGARGGPVEGEPLTVYRGASRELSPADFEESALGHATGHPTSGLGVYFTNQAEDAARYGAVTAHHLDIKNPLRVPIEEMPQFGSLKEATAYRNELKAKGYDGLTIDASHLGGPVQHVAFEPKQVIPVRVAKPEIKLPDVPLTIGEQHVNPSGESTAGAAAANTPTMRGETIAKGARTLAEGPVGQVSPGARLMASPSIESRKLMQELANLPETTEKNYSGVATASPLERELWKYEGIHYQGMRARGAQFRAYRERIKAEGGTPLNRSKFGNEISYAMRRGDRSPIPEVEEAARQTRAIEFEPLKQRAIKAGLLPEDVKAEGADSYLMRQYDARKISENLTDWLNRLKAGFMHQGVDAAEAGDIAHKATRNVLGSERGTMDWKTMDGIVPESGRMKERTLKLPDALLEPYLNNDIDHVAHSYLRSMAPEVEMHERFGSRDLKDQLANVRDDYARMVTRAGDDKAKQALQKRMDADLRDLTAVRDRLYGIYGQPKDPGAFFVRAGRLLRSENALRLLGAATLSHFPDLANVMMRFGLPNTFAAMAKTLTSKEAFQLTRGEAKRMGAALDMTMNVTASMLGDYGSHSQYAEQRVMNKLTRAFTIITGETPLITATQALTSTMAQDELIRSAQAIARGQKVDSNLLARTAAAGIDKDMLSRIAEQHQQFGAKVNGLNFGMSDKWADQEAARVFESAVLRDAHSVTLRPGAGDTPLLMSTEIGKSLLQFKSFGYAASRSVLNPMMQGLAHGDPRAVQALVALIGMGTATYVAKQKAAGQPLEPFDSPRLALEVIDKANLMGWMSEFIFPLLWQAGIKNVSRFGDRDAVETIGGPTAGTIASTYERRLPQKLAGNQTDKAETFNRSDLHFLRRLAPGQNLWYLRKAISATEDAVGDAFDLPGKSNAERAAENAGAN